MLKRLDRSRGELAVIGGVVLCIAIVAQIYLGGQVSTILSTVGSAVSDPAAGRGSAPEIASPAGGQGSGPGLAIVDVKRADLLVIRTGSLDLQVADVPRAVEAATAEVGALGGYVRGSEQAGDGTEVTATVIFRIPVDAWDRTLADLRSLAIKVVAVETRTDDVTADVVDLTARIANLEITERALQAIMSQATEVDDVLKIQGELTTVRGQIEEAVARKKHFEDQAAFSALTVRFALKPVPAVVATRSEFDPAFEVDAATARLVGILQHGATAAIWFAIVWLPFLLVFALGLVAVALIVRSRRVPGSVQHPAI